MQQQACLAVDRLTVGFRSGRTVQPVVHDVTFALAPGETVALVGESGCGKSVTALSLMRLLGPAAEYLGGSIILNGTDVSRLPPPRLASYRGKSIAYIFQEPGAALNPVFRVGDQIKEAVVLHQPSGAAREETLRLMAMTGLDPQRTYDLYPHQLSGGMQQRIMIAMALASRPAVLVADEATTALDVSVQAQIMALLKRLQAELGMAILLITHNLGLVADIARRVYIMYAGQIIEEGAVVEVLKQPRHPYTRGLMAAIPRLDAPVGELQGIDGVVPPPIRLPRGCAFAPRCRYAVETCSTVMPGWENVEGKEQNIRCHCWTSITPA